MWISHTYPEVNACAYTLSMACEGGFNFMVSGSFSLFLFKNKYMVNVTRWERGRRK
jgi:hypothetical protein